MKRLAAAALLPLVLGAIGCTSSRQEEAQEPAPSNQAAGETGSAEEGVPASAAGEAAQDQPPGPTGTTGSTDRDGDGIRDDMDRCPDEPEDRDGFEDEDGCPDPDNDRDGILDIDDKCPAEPEAKNGRQDEDGCPD